MSDYIICRSGSVTATEQSITGIACTIGKPYHLFDDYWEMIAPGAFDDVINNNDCIGCLNHDPNTILGRTSNGTLKLSIQPDGLGFELGIDKEDSDSTKAVAKIKRGDIRGCSFKAVPSKVKWERDGNKKIHVVQRFSKLIDVCLAVKPANKNTYTSVRSADEDKQLEAMYETDKRLARLTSLGL